MLDIIKEALSKELQVEPAEFMGTFGMGPGNQEDVPLSESEIEKIQAEYEQQDG